MLTTRFFAVLAALSLPATLAAPISRRTVATALADVDVDLDLVQSRLAASAKDTCVSTNSRVRSVTQGIMIAHDVLYANRWTAGTYGEALLELTYPSLSVFSPNFATATSSNPAQVVALVNTWESQRPTSSGTQELAYVENGAAGDPPALGVPWIVAATSEGGEAKAKLWEQAREQLEYLLDAVPRTQDGAISHRPPSEKVQLW